LSDSSQTDDNSELVDMDDFNAFESALFQRTPKEEAPKAEEVDENDDNSVANEEDQPEDQDEQDEADEAEDEAPRPEAKGKRNRTQERIEKLVTEARVAEREAAALRLELERFKASKEEVKVEAPTPIAPQIPSDAPQPNALNDRGEPIYPLGEFDPTFIKDLSTFYAKVTIEQETKAAKEAALQEAKEKEFNAQKAQLQESWNEKLEAVKEDLPDYNENIQKLAVAFQGVDPQYGDYLASTVMQCDNGPEIMYYLSQNIGEAQKIVASGPLAATLAIGKLQAKFEDRLEQKSNKKVSNAPTPPPTSSRGKGGQFQVRPDTDDLAAFERDFFK
jgi:hypothetical protein